MLRLPATDAYLLVVAVFLFMQFSSPSLANETEKTTALQKIGLSLPSAQEVNRYMKSGTAGLDTNNERIRREVVDRLAKAGFDANYDLDQSVALNIPVFTIYTKYVGVQQSLLAKGFRLQASVVQYGRRSGSGIYPARYVSVGQSPEVFKASDFREYIMFLVDVFISNHKSNLENQSKLHKSKKTKTH